MGFKHASPFQSPAGNPIGIGADFGPEHADTFRRDLHPDFRADTAARVSTSRDHAATWRDFRGAKDHHRLSELIDLIGSIHLTGAPSIARQDDTTGPSDARRSTHRHSDILGRVFEYFLTQFASAEGKNGGQAKCEIRGASIERQPVRKSKFTVRHVPSFEIRHSAFPLAPPAALAACFLFDLCQLASPEKGPALTRTAVCSRKNSSNPAAASSAASARV